MRWFVLLALSVLSAASCAGSDAHTTEATGQIAFVGEGREGTSMSLYRVNADGSRRRRLTHQRSAERLSFAWSPDGRKIAHSLDLGGKAYTDLYVIKADGSGRRRLSSLPSGSEAWDPVWSPDGRKIAFTEYSDGWYAIWVVNANGSGERRVTPGSEYCCPAWSPNGRWILTKAGEAMYVMRPDGRGRRLLARMKGAYLTGGGAWSPDGRRIAFLSNDDLWVMKADGTSPQKLVTNPRRETNHVAWSPDGRKIAFMQGDGDREIFVVNSDGSGLRKLTDNSEAHDTGPSWSPDGRTILFTSNRDGNAEIYVMNDDGSGQRNVSESPLEDVDPAWLPRH